MNQKGRKNTLIVRSLNVRGIREEKDPKQIADDMQKYKIDIMWMQEHHLKGTGVIEIRSKDNKNTYELFYTGPKDNKHHGEGVIVRKDLKADYKEITEKMCVVTIKFEKQNRNLMFISTYAPTLKVTEKDKNIREEFYGALTNTVNGINGRDMLIIMGNMDAKIGSGHHDYPECIGRYGKGKMNSNGKHLAEFALLNNLFLTNI